MKSDPSNPHGDDPELTPKQAGAILLLGPKALENMRARGTGPAWYKVPRRGRRGSVIRYRQSAVVAWLADLVNVRKDKRPVPRLPVRGTPRNDLWTAAPLEWHLLVARRTLMENSQ